MTILSILDEIAATSSKLEKQAILQREVNNELLKEVFLLAYDPTIKYYIKKIPEYTACGSKTLLTGVTQLERLSRRFVTGNDAVEFLKTTLSELVPDDATVLARIVKRDLRINCSESTANKVWKNLIPEFPYMRCSLPEKAKITKWNWKGGIFSQTKADGQFCNLDIMADGAVMMTSRSGSEHDITNFPDIIADAQKNFTLNARIHGELRIIRDGVVLPREISNGELNSALKGGKLTPGDKVIYDVWDIIPLNVAVPSGRYEVPYKTRFAQLKSMCDKAEAIRLIPTRIVYSLEEAYEHYFELVGAGEEGSVIKTQEGIWKDTTSTDQAKLKVVFEADYEIIGFTAGNGKNESTFGSITVATSDRELFVDVSGFKDICDPKDLVLTRQQIWEAHLRGEMIGTIMTVKANGIMYKKKADKKHSLFSPRFAEFRLDKKDADSFQRVVEQFEAVVNPK